MGDIKQLLYNAFGAELRTRGRDVLGNLEVRRRGGRLIAARGIAYRTRIPTGGFQVKLVKAA